MLGDNNNKKVVSKLAKRSLSSSRTRNIFILITIVLSVGLLSGITLFYSGVNMKEQRQLDKMQHVLYSGVYEEQLEKLQKEEQIEDLLLFKGSKSMEMDQYVLAIYYYEQKESKISTIEIAEGTYPEKINEIAVDKAYMKQIGKKAKLGETLSFSFLDGSEETFTISGFTDTKSQGKVYTLIVSKEYAEKGSQLQDLPYTAAVRIYEAEKMSDDEFLACIREIGSECGIKREDINENNAFVNDLSVSFAEVATVILIGIGILFVSVLVIYSVFYLSIASRIQQFGQLRTIGMTGKQIRSMVRKEGMRLCLFGAPIGLFLGSVFAYLVIPEGFSWKYTILFLIIVWIADFITVLISIKKPAKIAAQVSPIEALKTTGYEFDKTTVITKELHRKLTPFHLAKMSNQRNLKKLILTVISLGIGGVLFMVAATFTTSLNLYEYARQGQFKFGEFDLLLSDNAATLNEHGDTGVQMKAPFRKELLEKIAAIPGVKNIKKSELLHVKYKYHEFNSEDTAAFFTKEDVEGLKKGMTQGDFDYDHMVENDEILIVLNNIAEEIYGWKFETGEKITLSWFDGKKTREKEFTIVGAVNKYNEENYWTLYNSGWFLLPKEQEKEMNTEGIDLTNRIVISTEFEEKGKAIEQDLRSILEEEPLIFMNTFYEELKQSQANFDLTFKVFLGLAIFIIAFSFINLINTLISNIISKKRELAMLQSIGMGRKQITKMIEYEGLLLAFGNTIITMILGTICSYGMVQVLREFGGATYMHYHFPWQMLLIYFVVIIIVPSIVSYFLLRVLQKKTLVERLREIG